MKQAEIFIAISSLLVFAFQVSAQEQTPKIVWKNLQESYERFEDIAPIIYNESGETVFMPHPLSNAIEYGFVHLLKFDERESKWLPNQVWICGTMTKKERKGISENRTAYKFNSGAGREIKLDGVDWFNLTKSYVGVGFTESPNYNGAGKYKFQIPFTRNLKVFFISESPEFNVVEKDFKK